MCTRTHANACTHTKCNFKGLSKMLMCHVLIYSMTQNLFTMKIVSLHCWVLYKNHIVHSSSLFFFFLCLQSDVTWHVPCCLHMKYSGENININTQLSFVINENIAGRYISITMMFHDVSHQWVYPVLKLINSCPDPGRHISGKVRSFFQCQKYHAMYSYWWHVHHVRPLS
jgi:hypothetical protein